MGEISGKVEEKRLKWIGQETRGKLYMKKRGGNGTEVGLQGTRKRGRPRLRWMDKIRNYVKKKGVTGTQTPDRAVWRHPVQHVVLKWEKITTTTKANRQKSDLS